MKRLIYFSSFKFVSLLDIDIDIDFQLKMSVVSFLTCRTITSSGTSLRGGNVIFFQPNKDDSLQENQHYGNLLTESFQFSCCTALFNVRCVCNRTFILYVKLFKKKKLKLSVSRAVNRKFHPGWHIVCGTFTRIGHPI